MNYITKQLLIDYRIRELGYDFMGYNLKRNENYNYHHLIIPRRLGGEKTLENGAILVERSHQYLHTIETRDLDMFNEITNQIILMKDKGYIDSYNIRIIHSMLKCFEKEHKYDKTSKGKLLIKKNYLERVKF